MHRPDARCRHPLKPRWASNAGRTFTIVSNGGKTRHHPHQLSLTSAVIWNSGRLANRAVSSSDPIGRRYRSGRLADRGRVCPPVMTRPCTTGGRQCRDRLATPQGASRIFLRFHHPP